MKKRDMKLLYRSFDDELTSEEKERLKSALKESNNLHEEQTQITELRQTISSLGQRSFKPFFAERVMHHIEQTRKKKVMEEQFFITLVSEFRPVFIGALLLVIALISFNMIRNDRISLASAFAEPEVSLEEAYDPILTLNLESKR